MPRALLLPRRSNDLVNTIGNGSIPVKRPTVSTGHIFTYYLKVRGRKPAVNRGSGKGSSLLDILELFTAHAKEALRISSDMV